jgi:arylsulfatase A-like enzyme
VTEPSWTMRERVIRGVRAGLALGLVAGALEGLWLAATLKVPLSIPAGMLLVAADVVVMGVFALGFAVPFAAVHRLNRGTGSGAVAVHVGLVAAMLAGWWCWQAALDGPALRAALLAVIPAGVGALVGFNALYWLRKIEVGAEYPVGAEVIGAGIGLLAALGGGLAAELHAELRLKGTASADHLDVVLITVDTLRRDAIAAYGADPAARTPTFDALAKAGILFEDAVTPMPETAPAHAAMLTGLHPLRTRVLSNGHSLAPGFVTIAERLRDAGYVTGGFVSSFAVDSRVGLDQGFATYDDALPPGPPGLLHILALGRATQIWTVLGDPARTPGLLERAAPRTIASFAGWLDDVGPQPFFAWVHLFEPHAPYEPHGLPGFEANGTPDHPTVDHRRRMGPDAKFTDDERVTLRSTYREEVTYTDARVADVLSALRDRQLDGKTLVIVLGDHGEMLGEHQIDFTHHGLYDEAVRIPLIVRAPGRNLQGTRVPAQVRSMDVAPTILDWTGVAAGESEGFDLLDYATGKRSRPIPVTLIGRRERSFSAGALIGLRAQGVKYVRDLVSGDEQVFVLDQDPEEAVDRLNWYRDNDPAGLASVRDAVEPEAVAFGVLIKDEVPTVKAGEGAMLQQLGYQP